MPPSSASSRLPATSPLPNAHRMRLSTPALPEMLAGSVVFRQPPGLVPLGSHYAWWDWQPGADWRRPDGPR